MSITDYMTWSDELSVGIQEIDEQHKYLVDLVNKLNSALLTRTGQQPVQEALDNLIDYTRIHFVVEESLMRILGYADYETHKLHHEQLLDQVLEFKRQLHEDGKVSRQELMSFLKNWLINHIMKEDVLFSDHFLRHGAHSTWLKPSWLKKFW